MAKSRVEDTLIGMSAAPEGTYNAMVLSAAGHNMMKTRSTGLPIPDDEKLDDLGEIGGGVNTGEFATEQRSGFILPPTWEISNVVDAGLFLPQLRRFLGGADAVPAGANILEAGVAFQHNFAQLPNNSASGLQLPASTFVYSNNGLDYAYGGSLGNTLQVAQTGADDPTFSMGYVGSGLYKRLRDISPAFGSISPSTPQPKMKGAETELEFVDDEGPVIITANRQLVNFTLNANNAHDTSQRLAGASRIDPLDMRKGWYLDELLHGKRTAGADMRIFLDDTMRAYQKARNNTPITGFKFRMRGYEIDTRRAVVADPALDTFTLNGHGYTNGQTVRVNAATIPAGLVNDKAYYVIAAAANTFQLSETLAGAAVNFTTAGLTVTVRKTTQYTVELIFGKSFFRAARTSDAQGNQCLDIGIFPVADGITFGILSARAVNGVAGAIS